MTVTGKPACIRVRYASNNRQLMQGEEEKRRYKDLECALDDCLVKSSVNKIIVEKPKMTAENPYDYFITIYD